MRRASSIAAIAFAYGAMAQAAPPTKFTCATCHREQAHLQPQTAMGIGMELPETQTVLKQNPHLACESNGYKYTIEREDGVSTYTVSDGVKSLTLPLKYAFGVYSQTFVLEYGGKYYESLVSYYPRAHGLAVTMGSERVRPRNLVEAMGREMPHSETVSCFGCHSSNAVRQGKLTLDSLRPGLNCEHCHTGAAAHMAAVSQGETAPLPKKLGDMRAEDMSNFCGQCHRTWDAVIRMRAWGQVNVRFQPYRLANSKCFLGNDARISCTACHDPHKPLVRDDASYDATCLACHAQKTGAQPVAAKMFKACPVATSKCVSCHMPKVELPGSHSVFTDHQIRVVRAGEAYPD